MELNVKDLLIFQRKPETMEAKKGCSPVAFVPEGFKAEDLERFLDHPIRKRAKVTLTNTDSFIGYIARHGTESTVLYANADFEKQLVSITGVIADHDEVPFFAADTEEEVIAIQAKMADLPSGANWRADHIATYAPQQTVEWKRWNEMDGKPMSQVAFAEFLEENIGDIATVEGMPTGSDMLAMAVQFEATSDKAFRSKVNIGNGGVTLNYVDTANEATCAAMKVFNKFCLGLPVFIGAERYQLSARLKWRQAGTALNFYFELVRPDMVFKSSVDDELAKIADSGFPVLYGTPGL